MGLIKKLLWQLAVAGLLLVPGTVVAQSQQECTLQAEISVGGSPLEASWRMRKIDARGGIDSYTFPGGVTHTLRASRNISLEILDTKNDLFTTIIIDAEMILTADNGEIEVISDPFDQIILDPRYEWQATLDPAFTGQIFTTKHEAETLRVRTALDAFVVRQPLSGLVASPGPFGAPGLLRKVHSRPKAEQTETTFKRLYERGGHLSVDLRRYDELPQTITIDAENGKPNTIDIDLLKAAGNGPRDLIVLADPFDRLILRQQPCWTLAEADDNGKRTAHVLEGTERALTLTADAGLMQPGRIGRYLVSHVRNPSFRHLSVEARQMVDAINLKNRGKDVLILRNTVHLRKNAPIFIEGNEGDEIWLEGSAGWLMEFRDNGMYATVPFDVDKQIELAFAPGLEVKLLPMPPYLNNPTLLDGAYPGLPDVQSPQTTLLTSRGGYVRFSTAQFAKKKRVSFYNGAANFVMISPAQLRDAADTVLLNGEPGLDTLILLDMPEPTELDNGLTWQLSRPDGSTQQITATGFSFVARRN